MKYFISGFIIKLVTTIDDSLSRLPITSKVAHTHSQKLAFALGNLLAVAVSVGLILLFADFLRDLPYLNIVAAGLVLLVALLTLFDALDSVTRNLSEWVSGWLVERPSKRSYLLTLVGVSFFVSFILILDDTLALIPLFLKGNTATVFAIIGIFTATILQIALITYASEWVKRIRFHKPISVTLLLILAALIFFGVL